MSMRRFSGFLAQSRRRWISFIRSVTDTSASISLVLLSVGDAIVTVEGGEAGRGAGK